MRPGRGRHQGRAAGGRSDAADGRARRHGQHRVCRPQPRQARHRPRPEDARRAATRSCGSPSARTSSSRTSGPASCATLGLDYRDAVRRNPRLIYASISGYGQTGPDAAKGGFDLVAQGASGLMSVTGEPGGPPVKAGVPLTDLGAGLFALAAILAALHHRHRTGRGQHIDTSLARGRARAVGLGVGRVSSRRRRAAAARIGASLSRAVSGDSLRRRLHHDRRRHGSAVRRACASVLGHPEWARHARIRGRVPRASRTARRSSHGSKRVTVDAAEGALARAARRARHSVRADQLLRRSVRGSAGAGAADGRRRSITRRSGRTRTLGIADQDVGDAAGRSRAARRCSASTPSRCCARRGSARRRSGSSPQFFSELLERVLPPISSTR